MPGTPVIRPGVFQWTARELVVLSVMLRGPGGLGTVDGEIRETLGKLHTQIHIHTKHTHTHLLFFQDKHRENLLTLSHSNSQKLQNYYEAFRTSTVNA